LIGLAAVTVGLTNEAARGEKRKNSDAGDESNNVLLPL
jgi:hypothetical protein